MTNKPKKQNRSVRALVLRKKPINTLLDRLSATEGPSSTGERMNAAIGCKTDEVALQLLTHVARLEHPVKPLSKDDEDALLATSTALIAELHPATAAQGMLAAQMVGAHRLAMTFMALAVIPNQTPDGVNQNVQRAGRLLRLFTEQLDAMARLKGQGGQSRVVVEHVHIAPGGQAIVGAVTSGTSQSGGGALCPKPSINLMPSGSAG